MDAFLCAFLFSILLGGTIGATGLVIDIFHSFCDEWTSDRKDWGILLLSGGTMLIVISGFLALWVAVLGMAFS